MRPRKYQHLGEMAPVRVPNLTLTMLPLIQDVMEKLEANGRERCDVLSEILEQINDTL